VYLYAHLDEVPGIESAAEDLKQLQRNVKISEGFFGAFLDETDGEEFVPEDANSADRIVAVLWSEEQPGNTLQFRTPAFAHLDEKEDIRNEACELLFQRLDEFARARKCDWIQTLLNSSEESLRPIFTQAGFTQLAMMSYQLCTPEHFPPVATSMRLTMHRFDEIDQAPRYDFDEAIQNATDDAESNSPQQSAAEMVLNQVVSQTYEQTADCPDLQGQRTNEQIIAGYHLVGDSATQFWWIAELDNEPIGCLLMAWHRSENSAEQIHTSYAGETVVDTGWCELVYWGVVPKHRQQGFGTEILRFGMNEVRNMKANKLILAVDVNNQPALSIYQRLGFIEWLRQEIWVKSLA
jgi:RimJ/RimL family protein N-acetyltransferase